MRTITIILLLFFSLLLEQSCNLKKDKISEISGSQFKLWELKKGSPVNSRATYYYYFTHKGGFKICEKFYQSKKIEEYSGSDVYYQRTW